MLIKGKDNMRILLISANPHNAVGGIASWTKGYLEYCQKNNIICDLVDTAKKNKFYFKFLNEFARTYNVISSLKKKIVTDNCYDVIHLNSCIGTYGIIRDYFLARMIKKNRIPLVLHFHCDVGYWDKRKIIQFFMQKIIGLADCCIVLCSSSMNHLRQAYNKKSIIIPNCTDLKNVHKGRVANYTIKTVIYIGRISEAKGSIELFELAKRFPNKLFVLVGKVYLDLTEIDVPSNVKLLGEKPHEQVIDLLNMADVFLFPSHSEGFSIALTEAMAQGLPSIVTDVGANRDMVSNGAGIVVTAGDVDKMEVALKTIEDQRIRQEMSNSALQKVKNEYVTDRVFEKIILLYQGIINHENK